MNNNECASYKPSKLCFILLIAALASAAILAIFELIFVFRAGIPFKGIIYLLLGMVTIAAVVFLFLSVMNAKMQKFWLFGILGLLGSVYLQTVFMTHNLYHYPHALFIASLIILAVHYYLKGKYFNDKFRMIAALAGAGIAALASLIFIIIEIVRLIQTGNGIYVAYLFADMFFGLMYIAVFGAFFFYAPNKQVKGKAPEEPAPEA